MEIICRSATQVPGFGIVRKGRVIEWPDGMEFPPQVAGNFLNAADGTPLAAGAESGRKPRAESGREDAAALVRRTANVGRVKLAAQLDGMNVAYDEKMSATELAKILLRHNGETVE